VAQISRIRDRRYLPHWEVPKGVYFVTFRLGGSLPEFVLEELWAKMRAESKTKKTPEKLMKKLPAREIEKILDAGHGSKHLARPEIADVVESALRAFDGVRYKLFAWCLMPSHVHVVFQPLGDWELAQILHSWKSFTARRVQREFGIRGAFWQREYYDHLIRDGEQFSRAVKYVLENPHRAGLEGWRWVGVAPS
jgi:REP element-mobilizing transposase RayT